MSDQINVNQLSNSLQTKMDIDGGNATFPHVVETYQNETDWYRIWSDGWVEQGGRIASGNTTINLLKSFADTNYCVSMAQKGAASASVSRVAVESITKTTITITGTASNNTPAYWRACGQGE